MNQIRVFFIRHPSAFILRTERLAHWREHPSRKRASREALRVRLPPFPLTSALGRAAKAPVFQTGEVGPTPTGHSRGSANGRPAVFEAASEGPTPSPRTSIREFVSEYSPVGRCSMSALLSTDSESDLAVSIAPEDLRCRDYVAVLSVICE